MKTRTLPGWVLGLALAGGAAALGLADDSLNPSPTTSSSEATGAATPLAAVTPAAVQTGSGSATPQPSSPAPAVTRNTGSQSPAPDLHLSPWAFEIERLTQAGVDEGVALTYVNNSAGTFNLTADQIIYLKNQGVSTWVISAMLRHDQELISGARPMTAAAPPPLPPAVQTALAASLHATSQASVPAPTLATPVPTSGGSIIAPDNEPGGPGMWVWVEPDDVPDQPKSTGPVRVPYPVKLNDPIIVLKLPTFTVPCW